MKTILFLLLLFVVACNNSRPSEENSANTSQKIRIILDTDANNELDDQHAIAYMLFNSQVFDVEGVTVNKTFNGGDINAHFAEAERVVRLCDSQDKVSVFKGATGIYQDIVGHLGEENFDGAEAVNFIIKRAQANDSRKLVLLAVGKLTNIVLALKKDPSISQKVRVVWLGTNYPDPGEYNFVNDTTAIDPLLDFDVEFEMVMVRYGKPSGTDAVKAYLKDFQDKMPGTGPHISEPVTGRHGGSFNCFGDYSVNLFENFRGNPTSRPLFDMAAVAIVKNPQWADRVVIGAPEYANGKWSDQPDNSRKVVIWENFKKDEIMKDFYATMANYHLPE